MRGDHQELQATEFLDCDSSIVYDYARRCAGSAREPVDQAKALFYAVRDTIRYDVYGIDLSRTGMKASAILKNGVGFCIHKCIVFAALARSLGIPSRLSFADVRNHISSAALRAIVGGDVFRYHTYAEVCLNDRWVKTTPVFNLKLCHLFGVDPLEFDGVNDATLQPYDRHGARRLEFVQHHGSFTDFPYERCIAALKTHHPRLFGGSRRTVLGNLSTELLAAA